MIRSYFFNAIKECNSLLNAISTFSLYFFIHFWYCDIFWDISGHDNYQLKSFWLLSIALKIKTKFFPWTLKLQVLLLSSLLLCSVTLIWNPSTLSYHEFFFSSSTCAVSLSQGHPYILPYQQKCIFLTSTSLLLKLTSGICFRYQLSLTSFLSELWLFWF